MRGASVVSASARRWSEIAAPLSPRPSAKSPSLPPRGIEPLPQAPEACVISISPRGRIGRELVFALRLSVIGGVTIGRRTRSNWVGSRLRVPHTVAPTSSACRIRRETCGNGSLGFLGGGSSAPPELPEVSPHVDCGYTISGDCLRILGVPGSFPGG